MSSNVQLIKFPSSSTANYMTQNNLNMNMNSTLNMRETFMSNNNIGQLRRDYEQESSMLMNNNNLNTSMPMSKHRQELFSKIKGKPRTYSRDMIIIDNDMNLDSSTNYNSNFGNSNTTRPNTTQSHYSNN